MGIDRTVKTLFEANAQQCGHQAKSHCIVVRWNDAPIGHFLANYDGGLSFEYTIDSELGLKSVLYENEEKVCNGNTIVVSTKDTECESFSLLEKGTPTFARKNSSGEIALKYEVSFENITQQEEEYTVTISTELNGRTVTQTVERFPMGHAED